MFIVCFSQNANAHPVAAFIKLLSSVCRQIAKADEDSSRSKKPENTCDCYRYKERYKSKHKCADYCQLEDIKRNCKCYRDHYGSGHKCAEFCQLEDRSYQIQTFILVGIPLLVTMFLYFR